MATTDITIPILSNIDGSFPTHLGEYVSRIVNVLLIIAAIASFVYLVLGGLQWITAGGDKGKIEEARNRITGALVGLAITAAAWAIFLLVDYFFGLNLATNASSVPSNPGSPGSNLGSFTGVANCKCSNNGCAKENVNSTFGGSCYTCKTTGWEKNSKLKLSECSTPVQCGKCP